MKIPYKPFRAITFISCLKCSKIPIITIIPSVNIMVSIKCSCSSYNFSIGDYLHKIKNIHKAIINHNIYCQSNLEHKEKLARGYCVLCKEYLCGKCIKKHFIYRYTGHFIVPYQMNIDYYLFDKNIIERLFYCINCNVTFLDNEKKKEYHFTHYVICIIELMNKKSRYEIKPDFDSVNVHYKRILSKTKKEMLKRFPNSKELIQKAHNECIKKNKKVLQLIDIIICNSRSNHILNYQKYCNVFQNIHFTINKWNYKRLTSFSHCEDYYNFLKHFVVIEEEKILGNTKHIVSTTNIFFKNKFGISTFALHNEKQLIIIGYEDGMLSLFDQKTNKDCGLIKKDYSRIFQITVLPNNNFITCASLLIRYWTVIKINEKYQFKLLKTFSHQYYYISQAIPISENRIASLTKNGTLYIWCLNKDEEEVHIIDNHNSPYNNGLLFYPATNTLITIYFDRINFYQVDPFQKEKESIEIDQCNDSIFCLTTSGKLIFGRVYRVKWMILKIINIRTRMIETYYRGYYLGEYTFKKKTFFSIFEYDPNNIMICTPKGNAILFNLTQCNITQIFYIRDIYPAINHTIQINKTHYYSSSFNMIRSWNIEGDE